MITTILKWIAILAGCIVLQTAFIPIIAINGITPDLITVALFVFAMDFGMLGGTIGGFLIGLGLDLYAPALLGQQALSKTISGFFIGIFNERFMRTDVIIKLVILAITMLMHDCIFTTVTLVKTGQPASVLITDLVMRTLPRTIYTLVFAVLYYMKDFFIQILFRR